MNRADEHLSDEQIDWLVAHEKTQDAEHQDQLQDARRHLVACEVCQRIVQMHSDLERRLRELRANAPSSPQSGCPSLGSLYEVAAGIKSRVEAENVLDHAASCDHCGPLLRTATEDFGSASIIEEKSVLDTLESNQAEWQRQLARRLSSERGISEPEPNPRTDWRKSLWFSPRLALVGVSVLLIALSTTWFLGLKSAATADQLLAEAYTQQRTIELRISGASYGPLRVERTSTPSRLNRPAALLDAEALIAKKIPAHTSDSRWLQAKGRAELLDGNSDAAIQTLRQAVDLNPSSASLLTDLATAHFLRAETLDRPADYGQAVDLLGKALTKTPDDPVALFNRAIVSDRLFLFTQAVDDWEHYLRIDPSGQWSEEAKHRLADVKQKLQRHDQSSNIPLLIPSELVRYESQSHLEAEATVNDRFEQYLRLASGDWLAAAFPRDLIHSDPAQRETTRSALHILARIAKESHDDTWLQDFLSKGELSDISAPTDVLAKALKATEEGDFAQAQRYSSEAAKAFRAVKNDAGDLRARLEEVYALHLSEKGEQCVKAATSLAQALADRRYAWLNVQLHLEHAICEGMVARLDKAQELTSIALKLADQHGFGVLYMRGLALASNNDSSTGNYRAAWKRDVDALSRFWNGNYPSMRGYNVYSDLDTLADGSHQWHLQLAIWKQAIRILPPDSDQLLLAMAHSRLANSALMADDSALARSEFEETRSLFRSCPQSDATRNNEAEAEIALARLEALRADSDSALARLKGIEASLHGLSSRYVSINFYQTLGDLEARRGNGREAEEALSTAVELSEQALLSLHSQRDRLTWARETSASYRSLAESLYRRGDSEGSLALWEWFRGASLRVGSNPGVPDPNGRQSSTVPKAFSSDDSPASRLNEFRRSRSDLTKKTVISFLVLSNGIIEWMFDNRTLQTHWVATDRASLDSLANRFTLLCADPGSDVNELKSESRQLYGLLIAPFSGSISPDRTLVIEADGAISAVPFQALLDSDGSYLINRITLVWSPGLYLQQATRSGTAINSDQSALIVGSSTISPDLLGELQPLPNAASEAQTIAAKFHAPRLLLGRHATPAAVQDFLPNASIFHFSGHALSTPDDVRLLLNGEESAGVDNAFLATSSFNAALLHKTRLAVFSACSTEKPRDADFAQPESLVMTFLNDGVPNVVATRWNVDSASTEVFMTRFYDLLISGLPVAEALRATANDIRQTPNRNHPFYWSAFNAFGRG